MRRLISAFLIIPLLLSLTAPALAATNSTSTGGVEVNIVGAGTAIRDVQPGSWYYENARWALSLGLIDLNGRSFLPDQDAIRTDLVNALYKYAVFLGLDVSVGKDTNILLYADATEIKEGKFEAWQWAYGLKLIGSTDNLLHPNDSITREYLVSVLFGFAKLAGADVTPGISKDLEPFSDAGGVNNKAFQWSAVTGIIKGTSASTLSPAEKASRVQLAVVLYRFNEKFGKENYTSSEVIELYGNATTGYGWYPYDYDRSIIKVDQLMYIADKTGLVGSGGTFGFSISGLSAGTTTLKFYYIRPWDSDKSKAINTVTYRITVRPDLTLSMKAIA